uniref:RRM domain-containing protein n=1 Tax=Panagrellus redivivus TaxID=6233 RepID=A0A7E4ZT44_PANRE
MARHRKRPSKKTDSTKPKLEVKPKLDKTKEIKPKFAKIKSESNGITKKKNSKKPQLTHKEKSLLIKEKLNALSPFLRITNVPAGFVEEPAFNYFSQFGKVSKVVVLRNERGAFSGVVYVGFKVKEVAAVVASTLDKSLMGPENLIHVKHLTNKEVPDVVKTTGVFADTKVMPKKEYLEKLIDEAHAKKNEPEDHSALVTLINSRLAKAKALGIDYDFDYSFKLKIAGGIKPKFTPAKAKKAE